MLHTQTIGYTIGLLLFILGLCELLPAGLDYLAGSSNFYAFLGCSLFSLFFGGILLLCNYGYEKKLNVRWVYLLTTLCWLMVSIFGALPFYFSDIGVGYVDAFFETISGITTTGSTVLSGLDNMSPGIIFWRSLLQWIGGIGVVAFAMIFLPFLRIGGMQLFQAESSDRSEKIMAKSGQLIRSLLTIYCLLTIIAVATYWVLGMTFWDAINHAMTSIPSGGFSPHDASFGFYKSHALMVAAIFFMFLSAVPFVLLIKALYRGRWDFMKDDQFKALILMLIVFIAVLSSWRWQTSTDSLWESFIHSAFSIISIISSTGYATTDYSAWGSFAAVFFLFITFLGACAGSTTGGIKIMRLVIMMKILVRQIKYLIHPNGVFAIHYQGKPLDNFVPTTVLVFVGLFVLSNVVLTIALTLTGLDFETALSAASTSVANVGPGIGPIIGPSGNFSSLTDTAKLLMCIGMILGRLEILTVIVLFRPEYWKA
ncbi:MAG: TrkH family potassium uptake protein [Micavibrio sp.]|nr:TrkH family potassium uptake protein [Micavibrio sp.]